MASADLSARVAIGVPLYNGGAHVAEAIESLLLQTHRSVQFVLVDDCSTDETGAIARSYAERFPERLRYQRNSQRLGMIGNWRAAFAAAVDAAPNAEYFAWASDHDVWHPRWLEALVKALDAAPEAVGAYPLSVRIDETGETFRGPWRFETRGVADRRTRLSVAVRGMAAGDMVYGLYRREAIAACGIFRPVLLPDRMLLSELAIHGEFHQVGEILFHRRFARNVSHARQRRSFFVGRTPLYSFLPWWLVHGLVVGWSIAVRGQARPSVPRKEARALAGLYLTLSYRHMQSRSGRKVRSGAQRLRRTIRGAVVR